MYEHITAHSDGVKDVAFEVNDVAALYSSAVELERKADRGKTYFRNLLDPTPVMLQRVAAPPLSLATAEDRLQYFSRPGCSLAA
jgi:hypothetical protein